MTDTQTGVSILFVDDEFYLAEVGKDMLEDYGYDVTSVTSSKEALELFEKDPEHFDLVITDYTMPELNGVQLADRIKKSKADVPIILCTGISLDFEEIDDSDLDRVLMKPLDMDKLLDNVKEVLGKS